jgi:hypothetical protein
LPCGRCVMSTRSSASMRAQAATRRIFIGGTSGAQGAHPL